MNQSIKAIIIDDSTDSIEVMEELLKAHSDIEVAASADHPETGIQAILQHLPDVVFLDIEMPDKNGLELLDELKKNGYMTNIIFTTGWNDYAIEAIRHRAFDYLMKPIDAGELSQSLTRLRIYLKNGNGSEVRLLGETSISPARIKFNTRSGFILIDPDEIVYCRAEGNFTEVFYTEKEKEVISVQLGKIEPAICGSSLIRVGRSYIFNTRYIKEVDRKKQKCCFSKNGESFSLKLSYNYLKQLSTLIDDNGQV